MNISKLNSQLDKETQEILEDEFIAFRDMIEEQKNDYYVYALYGIGEIFYIGKGKANRAYDHLKRPNSNSFKDQIIRGLYEINSPPVVFIVDKNMTEKEAFDLERELIQDRGRIIDGTGNLSNMMPGYLLMKDIDKEKRRNGGLSLNITGKRKGCCTSEWWEENYEMGIEITKYAGKESWRKVKTYMENEHREWSSRGGKTTGKMIFWTNGKETTRSHSCPGDGWIRGNGNFNSNSTKHAKIPTWTNGITNKKSYTCPGPNYFNGITRNVKENSDLKNIVVYSKQLEGSNIHNGLNYGHNIVQKENS